MTISLDLPYILSGTLSLIAVIFAFIVGIKICSKYLKIKKRVFLLVGLTAIFISEPWWPSAFGFLFILITGQNLSISFYLFMGVGFLPLLVLFWLTAFTDLLYNRYQKRILLFFLIYGVIVEILLISLLVTNFNYIGEISGYFDPNYSLFIRLYQSSLLVLVGVTGILFARESIRSDDPDIKLKGKLFVLAIIIFLIGGILDIIALIEFPSPLSIVLMMIARISLFFAELSFYGALLLPNWMKKLLRRK